MKKAVDRFVNKLLALTEIEQEIIADYPRLRAEIRFQAVALVLCPLCFSYAVFNVAQTLLGYPIPAAVGLAAVAAFSLFSIDKHFLIQARGNSSDDIRRSIYAIRLMSIAIIGMSYILMSSHTFKADVDRELSKERTLLRSQLESSSQYKTQLGEARAALASAGQAVLRENALRSRVTELNAAKAQALQEVRDEVEGNVSDSGIVRVEGYGARARGHASRAERLAIEIETIDKELAKLVGSTQNLIDARANLDKIELQIEADTSVAVAGATARLNAQVHLLKTSPSAVIVMLFWGLLGLVPESLIFWAQRRMFNEGAFRSMAEVDEADLKACISLLRRVVRDEHTSESQIMNIHVEPVTKSLDVVKEQKPVNNQDFKDAA